MKELLGIEADDDSKDNILTHFLKKAREIIIGYCNISVLPETYDDIVADFAVYLYKNRDSAGIRKRAEGEKSVTYEEGIPDFIRLALPLPKIKVGY